MPVVPTYPDIEVGDLVTADMLTAIQPAVLVKAGTTARTSNVTPVADPDLGAITLGVGTWKVEIVVLWTQTTTATQGIKTMWGFSGTWNNPVRSTVGGGAADTTGPGATATVNLAGLAAGSSLAYGASAGTIPSQIRELSTTVVVTASGDLSLMWSQSATSANATTVLPGSYVEVKQIG